MAAIEIIKEATPAFGPTGDQGFGPTGTFSPRADQKKFVSAFGVISGEKKAGWQDGHTLQTGIPTVDGKAALRFSEFSDENRKPHDIKINGMTLREFVAPRADAEAKEKYDAAISNDKVRSFSTPVKIPSSETTVGRENSMLLDRFTRPEDFSG